MRNRLFLVASVLLAIGLVFSGCATPEAKVIKIATQGPLSGSMAVFGASIKDGTQLAIDQLAGPLVAMGFKVELAAFDDQGNPDTGVANAKSIVSDPAILAVVGHYNSGVQIPSSEEYHAAGLANVSPINTNPKVTDRGYLEVSRVCGRDDVQGAVGANFAAKKGIKSAYVIHDKTAYGQGIAEYFKRESEKLGIKILGFAGTEEKANFDSILSPILASKPEVIYFGGIFDQGAVLFKQARQKGYMGMLLSDDAFDTAESAKIGDPHVALGLVAGDGGAVIWPQLVGLARAKEYLLTGELLPAPKAEQVGLINHCLPLEELDAAVEAFCSRLLAGATNAIRST